MDKFGYLSNKSTKVMTLKSFMILCLSVDEEIEEPFSRRFKDLFHLLCDLEFMLIAICFKINYMYYQNFEKISIAAASKNVEITIR